MELWGMSLSKLPPGLQNKWDCDCFDQHGIENKLHFIDKRTSEKIISFQTLLDKIKYNRI